MQVDDEIFNLGIVNGALRLDATGLFRRRITVKDADEVDRPEIEVESLRVLHAPAKDQVKLAHIPPLAGIARPVSDS